MEKVKRRILFLCTGNACRSPMAEGLLRSLAADRYEALSAGSSPAGFVHRLAVEVMAEDDIDISRHRSKSIREFLRPPGAPPDVIVTLCESAARRCPPVPADVGTLHWPLFDPILAEGKREIQRALFRGVKNDLRALLEDALDSGALDTARFDSQHPLRRGRLVRWLDGLKLLLRSSSGHPRQAAKRSGAPV